jgi:predicted RNase H-like nuclease (RuvC/YqgF family)
MESFIKSQIKSTGESGLLIKQLKKAAIDEASNNLKDFQDVGKSDLGRMVDSIIEALVATEKYAINDKTIFKVKQQSKKRKAETNIQENSKKSIQKYEKEIAQLTKKVESMKKTDEYLAKQQEILNQQLMEMDKENSKIGDDSFHQKSPSVKSKPWSILDQNSPIN